MNKYNDPVAFIVTGFFYGNNQFDSKNSAFRHEQKKLGKIVNNKVFYFFEIEFYPLNLQKINPLIKNKWNH